MTTSTAWPWAEESLRLLDVREDERVLQLTGHSTHATQTLLELVGANGMVVVVEPHAELADRARSIDHPALHVLTLEPTGQESFGRFDAVFASPSWNVGWPIDRWGDIVKAALRPGGRFVLDLPGASACDVVAKAWRAAGEAPGLGRWRGPTEAVAADGLRNTGLRNVQGVVGTHLARFESPLALTEFATSQLELDSGFLESLRLELVRELRTNEAVEVVFHRTCLHGIR